MAIVRTKEVRRYLLRLAAQITEAAAALSETEANYLSYHLEAAQTRLENRVRSVFGRKVLKCRPASSLVLGTDYDEQVDGSHFWYDQYKRQGQIEVHYRPLISVEQVRLILGTNVGDFSNNAVLITFSQDWLLVDRKAGLIHIKPAPGAASVGVGGAASSTPLFSPLWTSGVEPNLCAVDYTAGLNAEVLEAATSLPATHRDVRDAVAKAAAIDVMENLLDLKNQGLVSYSLGSEGASESGSFDGVEKRMERLQKEVDRWADDWMMRNTPPVIA